MLWIYTKLSDGSVSVIDARPKNEVEEWLGKTMTQQEYEDHILQNAVNEPAKNIRIIQRSDLPSDELGETDNYWQDAFCDVTPESRVDIDHKKAIDVQLQKTRFARQIIFEQIGFPMPPVPEIEAILYPATKVKLQALRDVTEPLKNLAVDGYNDEKVLSNIKSLGVIPDSIWKDA
jgi:hypothetical protein